MPDDAIPDGFDHLIQDLYFRLEERDRWADHIINFLLAANGGGIVVAMTYAGVLKNAKEPVTGLLGAGVLLFVIGLALVGVLLLISAHSVRNNRRKARTLIARVLQEPSYTYAQAFVDMGDRQAFPSKWKRFVRLAVLSFAFFLVALAMSFVAIADINFCGA